MNLRDQRNIGDFRRWKENEAYQQGVQPGPTRPEGDARVMLLASAATNRTRNRPPPASPLAAVRQIEQAGGRRTCQLAHRGDGKPLYTAVVIAARERGVKIVWWDKSRYGEFPSAIKHGEEVNLETIYLDFPARRSWWRRLFGK